MNEEVELNEFEQPAPIRFEQKADYHERINGFVNNFHRFDDLRRNAKNEKTTVRYLGLELKCLNDLHDYVMQQNGDEQQAKDLFRAENVDSFNAAVDVLFAAYDDVLDARNALVEKILTNLRENRMQPPPEQPQVPNIEQAQADAPKGAASSRWNKVWWGATAASVVTGSAVGGFEIYEHTDAIGSGLELVSEGASHLFGN